MVIIGYKRMADVWAGSLVRTRDGSYILVTEYRTARAAVNTRDAYIHDSGEAAHVDGDEWVAIISLDMIETEVQEEMNYPEAE